MTYEPQIDDDLLRNVLYRTDIGGNLDPDSDEADELFALLIEGQLGEHDRELFLRQLDANPVARRAVSYYMQHAPLEAPKAVAVAPCQPAPAVATSTSWISPIVQGLRGLYGGRPSEKPVSSGTRHADARRDRSTSSTWIIPYFGKTAFACAAMLFVGAATLLWFALQPSSHASLVAMRGGPNLMDYGYNPDEIAQKGDDSQAGLVAAQSALDAVEDKNERDLLKEGYKLLGRNQIVAAVAAFDRAIDENSRSYYGWLGRGTAQYMDTEFAEAETAFRKATEMDPHPTAARINRAITLTQLGRNAEALDEWRNVDKTHLPDEQVAAISDWIRRAEEAQKE